MPIIQNATDDAPLSQGDIIEGVRLFATANSWSEEGGTGGKYPQKRCLVLSRPCNATHKPNVIVAAVEKYPDNLPREIESFDDLLGFLTEMRDGDLAPDVFYLGHLPQLNGRFCCRLDAIFSIEVPKDPTERQEFARKRRIATLCPDFRRDLHLRLFRAFASLGFEDHSWMSDDDLELLVSQGKSDKLAVEKQRQEAETAKLSKSAKGETVPKGQTERLDKLDQELAKLTDMVRPYEEELSRRKQTGYSSVEISDEP